MSVYLEVFFKIFVPGRIFGNFIPGRIFGYFVPRRIFGNCVPRRMDYTYYYIPPERVLAILMQNRGFPPMVFFSAVP